MSQYRILQWHINHFEPQVWRWWLPIWRPLMEENPDNRGAGPENMAIVRDTLEGAKKVCKLHAIPFKEPKLKPMMIHYV